MTGLSRLWGREPVMVIALVQATMALVDGFGLHLTVVQMTLVTGFMAALLGLLTRQQVTPLATLPDHIAAAVGAAAHADVPKIAVPKGPHV